YHLYIISSIEFFYFLINLYFHYILDTFPYLITYFHYLLHMRFLCYKYFLNHLLFRYTFFYNLILY
ncbi:hypothetical protein K492DRAFT_107753, partial [Lichtheimia hyalospora FSU 10163]